MVLLPCVALMILLTAAGCPAGALDEALKAAKAVERSSSTREVDDGSRALRDLNPAKLDPAQRQVRQQQLAVVDGVLERAAGAEVQSGAAAADLQIPTLADETAALVTPPDSRPDFLADVRAETREQIKSAACDTLLNAAAPEQTPDPSGEGAAKYATQAIEHLQVTWALPGSLQQVHGWARWTQGVVEDAQQVQAAVEANPQTYVNYATKPPVLRGTIAYARYCYARPR
ncbi:hypothetical protein GCM10009714_20880 [Microlunatus capsulatus]